MKTIKVMGGALAVALGVTTAFAAETRLTWAGGASGDWNAANAWTDEQGVASDWVDGAVAVLTGGNNTTVTIPEGVTIAAHGIDCTPDDKAVFYVNGKGTLRVAGDGVAVKGATTQLNIQNAGGLVLVGDQTWTVAKTTTLCLDNHIPFSAEDAKQLTVTGGGSLRVNATGKLTADTTVLLTGGAVLSPAPNGTIAWGLGQPVLVFAGEGKLGQFGGLYSTSFLDSRYASRVVLRDGADLQLNRYTKSEAETEPSLGVPVSVEGTATADGSRLTGNAPLQLLQDKNEVNVADGLTLTVEPSLANGAARETTAELVKTGSGTLALASGVQSVGFTVAEGTLRLAEPKGYSHYRFVVDGVRGGKATSMQYAEFKLLSGTTDITAQRSGFSYEAGVPAENFSDVDAAVTSYWVNEKPEWVVDGKVNDMKWLDYRGSAARIASEGSSLYIQLDYATPVVATGYSWATANDGGPDTGDYCRDPSAWRLLGSDDGESWTELDRRADMGPYAERKAWVGEFAASYGADRFAQPFGNVQIDKEGTLETHGCPLASIRVDCDNGGGTITKFVPASNGVLDLVCANPSTLTASFAVQLTIADAADLDNLATWRVRVNGVAKVGYSVRFKKGRLVVRGNGSLLIIR